MVNLSIIIPYYNSIKYLPKLLESIPNDGDIEVIIINDHSTSNLEEYSRYKQRYNGRNIRFIENAEDKKGAGAARNVGMKLAVGKYLMFVDADDCLTEEFRKAIDEKICGNADIIFFPPTSIKDDGTISARHQHFADLVYSYLNNRCYETEIPLRALYWSPCSKLIKREFIRKNHIAFDEIMASNDVMFSAKAGLMANAIDASRTIIYCITEHKGSLTDLKDKNILMLRKKINIKYYFYVSKQIGSSGKKVLGWFWKQDLWQLIWWIEVKIYELRHGKL